MTSSGPDRGMLILGMKKFSSAPIKKGVLVTLDKGFGELAIVRGQPHSGIVRLVMWSVLQQATICLTVLMRYGGELQVGAIVTAELGRIRVRPANAPSELSP